MGKCEECGNYDDCMACSWSNYNHIGAVCIQSTIGKFDPYNCFYYILYSLHIRVYPTKIKNFFLFLLFQFINVKSVFHDLIISYRAAFPT
jgi:hypothetical protein